MVNKTKIVKYLEQFKNPRNLGLLGFGIVALMVSWSGAKVIKTNYELQKQISRFLQQNEVQELENANLTLKNEYFKTDHFLELSARRHFGKAAPGEKVILVPKSVALKYTKDEPVDPAKVPKGPAPEKPWYQRNLEAWRSFLFP